MATLRSQAAKVGLFVVCVGAILLLALFVIGGLSFWRSVDEYHVVTDEGVSGIEVNASVLMRGVAIGRVRSIALDDTNYDQVTIVLEIDPDIPIPVGSKAYFERVGLTGERVIDISGGTLADGRLAPGSSLPREQTELERMQARVVELSDDVVTLVADLRETVQDVQGLVAAVEPARVTAVVEALDSERIARIIEQTERATATMAATSKQLERTVIEARGGIDAITKDIDDVASKAATVLEQAEDAAKSLEDTIDEADSVLKSNAADVRVALHNFRLASEDARALMQELRERPSLLLRSSRKRSRRGSPGS